MKQSFALIIGLFFCLSCLCGQSAGDSLPKPEPKQYRRIVGLNMTPLVTQLIPFNRSNPREAGPFLLRFKRYGARYKTAFRFSLGMHVVPDENSDFNNPQLNLAFGWERRRSISRRWSYTRGFDFMILGGALNVPGTENTEALTFAVGPMYGIEYFIDPRMSIGCEAVLALGFSPDAVGVVLQIIPPVGIFLNHYF